MEKLPSLTEPVKEEPPRSGTTHVKVTHAERLFAQQKQDASFATVFEDATGMLHQLRNRYAQHHKDLSEEQIAEYENSLLQRIDAAYATEGVNGVEAVLESELANLPRSQGTEDLFATNYTSELEHMAKLGYSANGDFVEIHMDSAQRHGGTNWREHLPEELERLAERIAREHKSAQAIVLESWLADGKLFNDLGFTTLEDVPVQQNSGAAWSQLVSNDGTLHEDRVRYLEDNGDLPYKARFAYMDVVEFLQKYAPDSLRNEPIELLRAVPERQEEVANIRAEVASMKKLLSVNWNRLLARETTLETVLDMPNSFPTLHAFIEQEGLQEEVLDFYRKLLQTGLSQQEIDSGDCLPEELQTVAEERKRKFYEAIEAYGYEKVQVDLRTN